MSPAFNQWEHLQLDVVLPWGGGPAPTATVTLQATKVLDQHPLFGGGATGAIITMNCGLEVYPTLPLGPSQLDLDDVLFNVAP